MEKTDYAQIMILFDPHGKTPLSELCMELVREDDPEEAELLKRWSESHGGELPAGIYDAIFMHQYAHLSMGFAVGYVIGQDYDIGDERVSAIVSDLRERILKAKALPYFRKIEQQKEEPQAVLRQN